MERRVESEILDELPSQDPRARHSRMDLRRLNSLMGNARTMAKQIRTLKSPGTPDCLVELGAGDGTFLLRLAGLLGPEWRGTEAVLVDRQEIVANETLAAFQGLGWRARAEQADVLEWLSQMKQNQSALVIANLFLHHFPDGLLRRLLTEAAARARAFAACEPRRSRVAVAGARLVKWVGCNDVTQNDAVVSVRAGFRDNELSRLWPSDSKWRLMEGETGLFSHTFAAVRL